MAPEPEDIIWEVLYLLHTFPLPLPLYTAFLTVIVFLCRTLG